MRAACKPGGRIALLVLLGGACGGDAAGPEGGGGDAAVTATVAGQAWASDGAGSYATASASLPGTYMITAARVRGGNSSAISLLLYNIRGPGSYPLGMGGTTVGGSGIVTDNAAGWGTPLSGSAGTVTVSALTANRIAGTFEFTAEAVSGGATGTRQVSNGRFDLPLAANPGPPAETAGHKLAATLGGSPWTAATVATTSANPSAFITTGSNTGWSVSITLSAYNGAGTYPLSFTAPGRLVSVQRLATHPQGAACCWGGAGSTGSVVVSSVTPSRTTGAFSGTLTPLAGSAATGTIVVTGGTFDIGRQ